MDTPAAVAQQDQAEAEARHDAQVLLRFYDELRAGHIPAPLRTQLTLRYADFLFTSDKDEDSR